MKLSVSHISLFGLPLLVGGLVLSSSLFANPSVQAASNQRYLEVKQTKGTVKSQQGQPVKAGDRLQAGSGISTSLNSSAVLSLDQGIGNVNVSPNTKLQAKSLKTNPDGSRTTRLYLAQGQLRSSIRPFNNPRSSYEIETPGGVAGTRGTEFGVTVSPNGQTGLTTIKGKVALTAQGKTVLVEQGYSSLIVPGQPPSLAQLTTGDTRVKLQVLSVTDNGQVRVTGTLNPVNLVLLNNQAVNVGGDGTLDVTVPFPSDRQIALVVITPSGEQQTYELEVPTATSTPSNTPNP